MKAYLNDTSLAVPGWPPGSASSGFQVPGIIFDLRNEILTLTNLYLDIHEGIPKCYLTICTWLSSRISLQRPPGTKHHFWLKNWNTDTKKPIFRHTWRHKIVWPPYLYLVSLQDQLLEASRSLQVKSSWPLVCLNKVIHYNGWVFETKNVIWIETQPF